MKGTAAVAAVFVRSENEKDEPDCCRGGWASIRSHLCEQRQSLLPPLAKAANQCALVVKKEVVGCGFRHGYKLG